VTFVQATNRFFADTQMFGVYCMPVWAYTLAAHLEGLPDIALALFDDRFDTLSDVRPADLFLFTGINQDYDAVVAVHRELKRRFPAARFVLGGPICWSFHTAGKLEALAMFDHLVVGDGEDTVRRIVTAVQAGEVLPAVIQVTERFALGRALPMHRPLLRATLGRYYGAVLEVSRGCPFLCEFCDIRILPDNNRAHVKDPALIVAELDALHDLGARQVLLACDNFIGDLRWAEAVCDRLIRWQEETGKALSLYTWLTINLARHPELLEKLRRAGFDLFFIGVESFNRASLLETAKVQNVSSELVRSLQTIQAYGFVVVAGLIFGFDTDADDVAETTLQGLSAAGLISGDPSLLTALPGTPLYTRMQLAGRLRDVKVGLGGFKYQTNIRYLRPAARLRADFRTFVREFSRGRYQYGRLRRFLACLDGGHYLPPRTAGYADLGRLLRLTFRNRRAVYLLGLRLIRLFRSPARAYWVCRGFLATLARTSPDKPLWFYFKFWLFNWSNTIVKYGTLSDADFDIESVPSGFGLRDVLPADYEAGRQDSTPPSKMRAQRRVTAAALRGFVEARQA
jgi:radical SAM superfamily enzyme YgiQ (UPF0313 family)